MQKSADIETLRVEIGELQKADGIQPLPVTWVAVRGVWRCFNRTINPFQIIFICMALCNAPEWYPFAYTSIGDLLLGETLNDEEMVVVVPADLSGNTPWPHSAFSMYLCELCHLRTPLLLDAPHKIGKDLKKGF